MAFGALTTLVTAIQVGREEGVLHVSYCSMEPWLAGQLLSGPLPGCAQCLLLQSEAHFLAISLLEEIKTKKTNKQTNNKTIFRKEKLQMIKKLINKHINHASLTLSSS